MKLEHAIVEWRSWRGREQAKEQVLDANSLHRFAAAVGHRGEPRDTPLLHWAWFLDAPPLDGIGLDGHPERGAFLPPISLPRRMFASAEVDFEMPVEIGESALLRTTIDDVELHRGSTGDLVFVTLSRELVQATRVRVRERRKLVYRDLGDPVPLPLVELRGDWVPGVVELFRFSAATFNAHRIHYDAGYAKEEGYPELVVHGPLTAARLAGLAARSGPLHRFEFRAKAPLFARQPIQLTVEGGDCRAVRCDGVVAMTATAVRR